MLVETDISTSGLRSNHKGALITPLRRLLGDTGPHPPWDDSAPIRAELFRVERLEEHARSLAVLWSVMAFAGLGEGDKAAALFWMLNPINHARTRSDIHRYKAEPYVVAADVYAAPAHVGRGGWTWYTGSGGWDATRRRREHPWTSHRGQCHASRALHSQVMAPFRDNAPTRRLAV